MDEQNEILDDDQMENVSYTEEYNIVSTNKFILLYIVSFGLYGLWWTYKAWRVFKKKDNSDIMPAMRAFFSILFLYSLFENSGIFRKGRKFRKLFLRGAFWRLFYFQFVGPAARSILVDHIFCLCLSDPSF